LSYFLQVLTFCPTACLHLTLQDLQVLCCSCQPPSICQGIAASFPQLQGLTVRLQLSSSSASLAALRGLTGLKRLNLSLPPEPLPAPLPLHPHMSALSQLVELDVDFDPSSAQLLLAPGLASCASLTSVRLFTLPMDVAAGFSAPRLGHLTLKTVHIHDLPLLFDQTRCGAVWCARFAAVASGTTAECMLNCLVCIRELELQACSVLPFPSPRRLPALTHLDIKCGMYTQGLTAASSQATAVALSQHAARIMAMSGELGKGRDEFSFNLNANVLCSTIVGALSPLCGSPLALSLDCCLDIDCEFDVGSFKRLADLFVNISDLRAVTCFFSDGCLTEAVLTLQNVVYLSIKLAYIIVDDLREACYEAQSARSNVIELVIWGKDDVDDPDAAEDEAELLEFMSEWEQEEVERGSPNMVVLELVWGDDDE